MTKQTDRVTRVKENDLRIAREFKSRAEKILGDNLVSVILYGSRARGTAREDSDMDILLLTKREIKRFSKTDEALLDATYAFLDQDEILITAIPYTINDYDKRKELVPVLYWIEKEGIRI